MSEFCITVRLGQHQGGRSHNCKPQKLCHIRWSRHTDKQNAPLLIWKGRISEHITMVVSEWMQFFTQNMSTSFQSCWIFLSSTKFHIYILVCHFCSPAFNVTYITTHWVRSRKIKKNISRYLMHRLGYDFKSGAILHTTTKPVHMVRTAEYYTPTPNL